MASGTIENPNIVISRDYTQVIETFAAGNPGSRAAQYSINDIGINGYRIISSQICKHPDSLTMNCKTFLKPNDQTSVYLNIYRASGNAYTVENNTVGIRVTYLKT